MRKINNNMDEMRRLINLVESAQVQEEPMSKLGKAAATALATGSVAGDPSIANPDTKPEIDSRALGNYLDLKKEVSKEFTADWIVRDLLSNAISVKTFGKKGKLSMDIASGKLVGDVNVKDSGGRFFYKFSYTHQMFPSIHLFGKRFGIDIAKGKKYTGAIVLDYGHMTQNHPIQKITLILDYDNIEQHKANAQDPEKRDRVPFIEYPRQPGAEQFIGKPITDVLGLDPKGALGIDFS